MKNNQSLLELAEACDVPYGGRADRLFAIIARAADFRRGELSTRAAGSHLPQVLCSSAVLSLLGDVVYDL